MKKRLIALALAGIMLLALAACGGGADGGDVQPAPEPTEVVAPAPEGTDPATASPIPDKGTPPPSDSTDAPGALCPDSDAPTPTPTPTPGESAAPTPEPTPEPAKALTAAELRDMFMLSSSRLDAPTAGFTDMSAYVDAYYTTLDTGDVESFVFYQPDMSSSLQEFFLAKAKPGKVSAVKAAVQDRLDALKEEAEFYPGTSEYVDAAKVESVGDWVVLAACPEGSRMVKILQDTTK